MSTKRLLFIVGSARKKGTSYSFARTMKMLAENEGNTVEMVHAIDYFDGKESFDRLKNLILQSDILAMIAPLYADTLPYFDIWLLERLVGEFGEELKGKSFFGVGQCGFPDITRMEPLLNACRFFAEEAGMQWLGGLAYGGGPMINGALMEDLGKKGEKITLGFKLALNDILREERIRAKPQELLTVKIPRLLFRPLVMFLNRRIKKLAKENGNADFTKKAYLE